MTKAITIEDKLIKLGTLENNKNNVVQRKGALSMDRFFESFDAKMDDKTTTMVLHYLTETQVRDYALGILDRYENKRTLLALTHLMNKAPADTRFINAPATLLAIHLHELGKTKDSLTALDNVLGYYSLAALVRRVFLTDVMPSKMFAEIRTSLHPKVVAGIFGTPQAADPADAGIDGA